jgi:hypothetical protein
MKEMKHLDAWACVQSSDIFGNVTYMTEQDSHQGDVVAVDAADDADMESTDSSLDPPVPVAAQKGLLFNFAAEKDSGFSFSADKAATAKKPFTFGASSSGVGGFSFGQPTAIADASTGFSAAARGKAKAKRSFGKSKPAPFSFNIPKIDLATGDASAPVPNSASAEEPSTIQLADVTYRMAKAIRHVFAAFMWHSDIINDAMAVATHLKFEPDLLRPEVSSESARRSKAALEAFSGPAPPLDALGQGTKILVQLDDKSKGVKAATIEKVTLVEPGEADAPTLAVGQRLEAKDRQNPHMICKPTDNVFMLA